MPECPIDLRVGGRYMVCERTSSGKLLWITGTYLEIVVSERIVNTPSFAGPDGNVVPATHYGLSTEFPLETLITVTFEARGNRTAVTSA
jgi:uncharacterized protein YndB with AHSA1/START domain